ncbi:MAG: hypothetical protein ACFB5Z_16815 [Elainellaceae cyanobacterium]
MDFIKKIFVGILGFLQGLLGGIVKTLGIGKSEYFLELTDDSDSNSASPDSASPSPNRASSSGAASANGASAAAPASSGAKQPSSAASNSSKLATPGAPSPKPSPEIVTSPSSSAQSIQSPAQPRTAEPAASTVVVSASVSNNGASDGESEKVEPFAPNFLLNRSTVGGRRRPGPSLNPFRDMAKDMGGAS